MEGHARPQAPQGTPRRFGIDAPGFVASRDGLALKPLDSAAIEIDPGKSDTIPFYAEDGRGWRPKTTTRRSGGTVATDSGPVRVSRKPVGLRYYWISGVRDEDLDTSGAADITIKIKIDIKFSAGTPSPRESIRSSLRSLQPLWNWLKGRKVSDFVQVAPIDSKVIRSLPPAR